MKKIIASILIVTLLSACSENGNNSDEVEYNEDIDVQHIEIPTKVFNSDKENSEIDEAEIKESIKVYLDSNEALDEILYAFEDALFDDIDDEVELNEDHMDKLAEGYKIIQENDDNFSHYISSNTLPADYQKETEKISEFIITYNELHYELGEKFMDQVEAAEQGQFAEVDLISIISKMNTVKGKEQEKIEKFLKKKNIKTKAFGMED